jgi:hypothetical protein
MQGRTRGRKVLLSGDNALQNQRDTTPEWAEAVAIRNGKIVTPGRMLMPGIVDGHYHGQGVVACNMGYDGGRRPMPAPTCCCRRASCSARR